MVSKWYFYIFDYLSNAVHITAVDNCITFVSRNKIGKTFKAKLSCLPSMIKTSHALTHLMLSIFLEIRPAVNTHPTLKIFKKMDP